MATMGHHQAEVKGKPLLSLDQWKKHKRSLMNGMARNETEKPYLPISLRMSFRDFSKNAKEGSSLLSLDYHSAPSSRTNSKKLYGREDDCRKFKKKKPVTASANLMLDQRSSWYMVYVVPGRAASLRHYEITQQETIPPTLFRASLINCKEMSRTRPLSKHSQI
jgi:hypothetical protein